MGLKLKKTNGLYNDLRLLASFDTRLKFTSCPLRYETVYRYKMVKFQMQKLRHVYSKEILLVSFIMLYTFMFHFLLPQLIITFDHF